MTTLAHDPNTAGAAAPVDLDPEAHGLVEASRVRVHGALRGRDGVASAISAAGFLGVAAALALLFHSDRSPSVVTLLGLVLAYAAVSLVEFEVGAGTAVPTQVVFVPMLFLVPVGQAPLLVAAGLLVGGIASAIRRRDRLDRVPVLLASSWHAVGPALVLAVAGERGPSFHDVPLYLLAFGAQFAFDLVSSIGRDWVALGVPPRAQLRVIAWVYLVDAGLVPVGLLAAFVAVRHPYAFVLTLPLVVVLAHFARERQARIDHALELGQAYRGTAFLLGDVIEADDAYTGSHSRDVVTLVLAVADELRVSPKERRTAEFAALLHDVGKIRIPSAIINKPGPLDAGEWEIMKSHTLEGERMLEKVGGLLGNVGRIVRSCHERWDGGGYPDGLAGEAIPLVARIVVCCDAFDAMTSDRSYRRALPLATAIEELQANRGTQFDPQVVDALVRVLARDATSAGR